MKIEITAVPRYWLHMSLAHAMLLQKLSSIHYDSKCKRAGLLGGFLYGWINQLTPYEGAKVAPDGTCLSVEGMPLLVTATFDELETCLKIMEFPPPVMAVEERTMIDDMFQSFMDAFKIAESAVRQIQLVKE